MFVLVKSMAIMNIDVKWSNYELTQPEWLWLIPLFIIAAIIIPKVKNKYISKTNHANLANISKNDHILYHPLISLLSLNKSSGKLKIITPSLSQFYIYFISNCIITPCTHWRKTPGTTTRTRYCLHC